MATETTKMYLLTEAQVTAIRRAGPLGTAGPGAIEALSHPIEYLDPEAMVARVLEAIDACGSTNDYGHTLADVDELKTAVAAVIRGQG